MDTAKWVLYRVSGFVHTTMEKSWLLNSRTFEIKGNKESLGNVKIGLRIKNRLAMKNKHEECKIDGCVSFQQRKHVVIYWICLGSNLEVNY